MSLWSVLAASPALCLVAGVSLECYTCASFKTDIDRNNNITVNQTEDLCITPNRKDTNASTCPDEGNYQCVYIDTFIGENKSIILFMILVYNLVWLWSCISRRNHNDPTNFTIISNNVLHNNAVLFFSISRIVDLANTLRTNITTCTLESLGSVH